MNKSPRFAHRPVSPAPYLLRFTIVVLMIVAAATFLHLNSIMPKQIFLSCDRPCHHLDWPMICRVKLVLEEFNSPNTLCKLCSSNDTECSTQHCNVNTKQNQYLLANRQIPGPSIQVCENDILVVDVINRLPGKAAAVHWRGQLQTDTPFMDGVPLITQCPIPSYTTFQYKFRANVAGTHMWHAHAGDDMTNGIFGSLIVKQADIRDPHRSLYDIDDPNHVLLLTQLQDPTTQESGKVVMLINGKQGVKLNETENSTKVLSFHVRPGRRHRFRVVNAAGAGSCPMVLSVDNHKLVLIALDGHPINARVVTSVILAKGERADFVLKANNQDTKSIHWIRLRATDGCRTSATSRAAIIQYKHSMDNAPAIVEKIGEDVLSNTIESDDIVLTSNPTNQCESPDNLCLTEIQSVNKMPVELSAPKVDVRMYLAINFSVKSTTFLGSNDRVERKMWTLDNTTFTFPSSPLLTQNEDVEMSMICSGDNDDRLPPPYRIAPDVCRRSNDNHCDCVHVKQIPLGATVEIILFDQAGIDDLVYHLHGYSFYVVGARQFDRSVSLKEIEDLDKQDLLFTRNLECAPLKDTIIVTKYSAVAIRFKANNPGYWLLRDEHAQEWTRGLDVILKVGELKDMYPPPSDFPKCGSFVGPDYFLI